MTLLNQYISLLWYVLFGSSSLCKEGGRKIGAKYHHYVAVPPQNKNIDDYGHEMTTVDQMLMLFGILPDSLDRLLEKCPHKNLACASMRIFLCPLCVHVCSAQMTLRVCLFKLTNKKNLNWTFGAQGYISTRAVYAPDLCYFSHLSTLFGLSYCSG